MDVSNAMERKPKTIFQLDTPFTAVEWPKISDKDQKLIFELLISVLAQIGQHRINHVTRSKGKRSQKRKRQEAKEKARSNADADIQEESSTALARPEIQKHVVVGLNSILRDLQALSQRSKPHQKECEPSTQNPTTTSKERGDDDLKIVKKATQPSHFAALFALTPSPTNPTLLSTHLPTLIYTASLSSPNLPAIRLIPLSLSHTQQLTTVLSLPRISHIGILDSAPGAEALIAVIREVVPEIKIPWLDEAKKGEYLGVKINAIKTFVGVGKKELREMKEKHEKEKQEETSSG
ncbi:hypothetical protein EG329_011622 [Mollisiaceae sp. DMI_Dod_QoI]|nr:hypothetical protein EG329_011622 [Helotiales sp. DMI_Dod_QoI]